MNLVRLDKIIINGLLSQNTTATDSGVDSHKKASSVDIKGVTTKDGSTGWLQLLLLHCAFQLISSDAY